MPAARTLTHPRLCTRWRSYRRPPSVRVPRRWRDWLLNPGSLTQRLISLSAGDFRVDVVYQGWSKPTLSEARALNISPRLRTLVREVRLCGHDQTWVYARTIIPQSTLTGPQRALQHLGNRPLGAMLFKDPNMRRGPMQTAALHMTLAPASLARPDMSNATADRSQSETQPRQQPVWGRRSVFYLAGKPLLVSEVFLPQLLEIQKKVETQQQA